MLPDLSSVKWSIDDKNKIMTIDDITFPIKANDYIGKSEPKYVKPKENPLLNMLNYLYWILFVITIFVEKNEDFGFFLTLINLTFFVVFSSLFFAYKNIFLKIIFFLLTSFMVFVNIGIVSQGRWDKNFAETFFVVIFMVSMLIIAKVATSMNRKIEKNHKKQEKEYYESDSYRKEYYDKIIKPYLLYEYLKKKIPIYSELKDNQELIESDNFKSDNIDVLMSKIYVKAFLLDATAIVINQNNISNEVNGHVNGYVNTTPNGQVYGSTKGKIETKTTHFANVSFVRNKER